MREIIKKDVVIKFKHCTQFQIELHTIESSSIKSIWLAIAFVSSSGSYALCSSINRIQYKTFTRRASFRFSNKHSIFFFFSTLNFFSILHSSSNFLFIYPSTIQILYYFQEKLEILVKMCVIKLPIISSFIELWAFSFFFIFFHSSVCYNYPSEKKTILLRKKNNCINIQLVFSLFMVNLRVCSI